MSRTLVRSASRPVFRVLFAAVLLAFGAVIAPICVLMVACSTPCCEATPSACAEHCGIAGNTASHELPNAVIPSNRTTTAFALLAGAEPSEIIASAPAQLIPAFSVETHHAIPGDAPVYLYNSVFLI